MGRENSSTGRGAVREREGSGRRGERGGIGEEAWRHRAASGEGSGGHRGGSGPGCRGPAPQRRGGEPPSGCCAKGRSGAVQLRNDPPGRMGAGSCPPGPAPLHSRKPAPPACERNVRNVTLTFRKTFEASPACERTVRNVTLCSSKRSKPHQPPRELYEM